MTDESEPTRTALHQPWRATVAGMELLLVTGLIIAAVWAWRHGALAVDTERAQLLRVDGRWWAVAALLAIVAGVVFLDALREITLAVRARPRRGRPADENDDTSGD